MIYALAPIFFGLVLRVENESIVTEVPGDTVDNTIALRRRDVENKKLFLASRERTRQQKKIILDTHLSRCAPGVLPSVFIDFVLDDR
jgi:hypothetical protein